MQVKLLKVCLFAVIAALLLPGISYSADWHTTVVDTDFEDGWIFGYISIQVNEFAYPCISYISRSSPSSPYELRYAFWDGASWQKEVVDSNQNGTVGRYCSLALDGNECPHIAYEYWDGDTATDYLLYARNVGAGWEISTVDTGAITGRGISLALDSQGYPHISYYANDSSVGYLKYAQLTESGWQIEVVDNTAGHTSLALDSQDHPHITYDLGYSLKYAENDGSTWNFQVIDSEPYIEFTGAIDLDSQDYPHILYDYDPYTSDASESENDVDAELRYARWTGTEWEIQVIDINQMRPSSPCLVLDHLGDPHFCSIDNNEYYGFELEYGFWDGSDWAFHTVYDEKEYYSLYDLALDAQDYPHISFYDFANDFEPITNALKYTWYGDPLNAISLLFFTATPQEDSSVLLNWQVETTEGEQIAGFNLYRREINNDNDIAAEVSNLGCIWTKVNSSLITGQNPYAYTDSAVEPGKSYEYKLEAVLVNESTEILGTASCAPTPPAFAITKVYPNPASDVLNIALTLPQSGEVTLELYDLTGRVVATKDIQISSLGEFTDQLDVRELANGVYTLRATQMNLSASERVVVVR